MELSGGSEGIEEEGRVGFLGYVSWVGIYRLFVIF